MFSAFRPSHAYENRPMYYLVVVALVAARRTAVPQQIFRLANRCFLRPS